MLDPGAEEEDEGDSAARNGAGEADAPEEEHGDEPPRAGGLEELLATLQARQDLEDEYAALNSELASGVEKLELLGGDWGSLDIVNWLMTNSISKVAGDTLLQLLNKHGINHGQGLAPEVNSMQKIHKILDKHTEIPFKDAQVELPGWAGTYHLHYRDLEACLRHMFAQKRFHGHMDLKFR